MVGHTCKSIGGIVMACKIVIGAQWGDEGKGKLIDILAQHSDIVVRSQGGNNAGHTVVAGNTKYKLHLVPSGIIYPGKICIVGNGVVVDPKSFIEEMNELKSQGVNTDLLIISDRAHIVFPYHKSIDGHQEVSRGNDDIGTTKRGIGPCYMDKVERIGIRFCDLLEPETFKQKVRLNVQMKNLIVEKVYNGEPFDSEEIIKEYLEYGEILKPHIKDTVEILHNALRENKEVLFEGAQASFLDVDLGTYPYVTSSHPVSAGVCIGSGIGPTAIDSCIGVAKAYTTRVGKGPFITEQDNEIGDFIRREGNEYGTTTGRPRRCGWLDAVMLRFAVLVNGLDGLCINHVDTIGKLEEIKLCVGYKRQGQLTYSIPASLEELDKYEPIYETFKGWTDTDISGCRKYEDLPENTKKYIKRIEEVSECRVKYIGVGPGRDDIITR